MSMVEDLAGAALEAPPTDERATPLVTEGTDTKADESPLDKLTRWADPVAGFNIATEIDNGVLGAIGQRVVEQYNIDETSRSGWLQKGQEAMDLAMQNTQEKTYPWPKASNVIYPAMTEAANQFAARAYPAIIENTNVVKGVVSGNDNGTPLSIQDPATGKTVQVPIDPATGLPKAGPDGQPLWGEKPGEKTARAQRIGRHMSYQLLEQMPEWEEETDKLLNVLPITGCEFRKTFFSKADQRNMSVRLAAKDVVINYKAKSLKTAPRITEINQLYPYEILENKLSGFFLDVELGVASGSTEDPDFPHTFLEQHRREDLDGDGYSEPYIIIVHKESMQVVRITARFEAEDIKTDDDGEIIHIKPTHYYTKYDFLPNREGGIYGMGFAHLLLPLNQAINTTLNMLIDAGHLKNTGGGFVGKSLSLRAGNLSFSPGEMKVVNASGQDIRQAIVMLQHEGADATLFSLLGALIEAARNISSVKDVLTGEVKAQTMSPTVFLSLVEQGLKQFTAIYKRVHRSLKEEFRKLYRLNRLYLEEQEEYLDGDEWKTITRADYDKDSGVAPVSDPTMVVDVQRMARSEFLMTFKDDQMMDGREIRLRALKAASIEEPEKLLISKPPPNPEIVAKLAELQLRQIEVKAKALSNMAQAVKFLAEADLKGAQEQGARIQHELDMMMTTIEAMGAPANDAGAGAPGATMAEAA